MSLGCPFSGLCLLPLAAWIVGGHIRHGEIFLAWARAPAFCTGARPGRIHAIARPARHGAGIHNVRSAFRGVDFTLSVCLVAGTA